MANLFGADYLIGRTIKEMRPMTAAELDAEGWDDHRGNVTAIVLDNGTVLYPSQDDEGNGSGALFGHLKNGETVAFHTK